MQDIISAWEEVTPPDNLKEYHLWIRNAMGYDKETYRVMKEYYQLGPGDDPAELKRLRNMGTELMILKDQALMKAEEAYKNR
jgi:hypothetical protein